MNEAITLRSAPSAITLPPVLPDLHSLLAAMPWAVLLLDTEGAIMLANPATVTVWGLPPLAQPGSRLLDLLPPHQYPELHELLAAPAPAQGECYLAHCAQWLALSTVQLAEGLALYAQDITEWRRTELAAHEQAHLLASISNATPDLIYTLDLQQPCISYANGRVQALLGYSPKQVAAQGAAVFARVLHPDDYALRMATMAACKHLREDEVKTLEVRLRLAGGEYHWFRLRDRAFRRGADGQVTHTIGIGQDVQAEREATALLAQQHELLRGVFAGAQVGLSYQQAVRDAQGRLVDFRLQTLNPASLAAGRAPEMAPDQLLSEALPHLRQHELWGRLETALTTGRPERLETYYQHLDLGAWLDVSITPLGDGLILSSLDISARKAEAAAVIASRLQLQQTLDALPQLVWTCRPAGQPLFFNARWYAYTGLDHAQALSSSWIAAVHPDDLPQLLAQHHEASQPGGPYTFEVRVRRHDGSYRWHLGQLMPLRDDTGEISQWVGSATDIDDRKKAESELQENKNLLVGIFNTSSQAFALTRSLRDAEGTITDFAFLWTNAQCRTLLAGYDLTGQHVRADFAPHFQATGIFERLVESLQTEQLVEGEFYCAPDGQPRWLRWTAARLGDGSFLTLEDVTQRKQAEAERLASHALLQGVLNAPNVNVIFCAAVRNEAGIIVDFRLVLHSQSAQMLYAHQAGPDLLGQSLLGALPGHGHLLATYRTVVDTGQATTLELPYEHAGTSSWLRLALARHGDGLVYVWEDITASKLAGLEIRRGQELLQAVFDSTTDGIEVFKSIRNKQGEIVDFEWILSNQVSQRLLRRTDLVGKRWLQELPGVWSLGLFGRHRRVADLGEVAELEWQYQGEELHGWFHSVAVRLGDGLLLTWQDITERKRLQAETLRLQLTQQQQLAQAVLGAEENEKRRIAESLHNGLGQLLYATKLSLLQLDLAHPTAFASAKQKASGLLSTAIVQARTLSHELMPQILEDFGLEVALQDICAKCSVAPLRMRYRVDDLPPRLSPHLALALYRMAQELANNIVKHAQATRASLQLLGQADGTIELRADDNGVGFALDEPTPKRNGIGLQALHDRARLLRGTLHVHTTPSQGTQIIIRLPWAIP